jgi:hypothetical protein
MNAFHVWIRPLGHICGVRVDGIKNAEWLLKRLGQSFVFKSCEPVREEHGSSCCSFRVMYSSQMSHPLFRRLLAAMPEINLVVESAA